MLNLENGIIGQKLAEIDRNYTKEALEKAVEDNDAKAILTALGDHRLDEIEMESVSGDALIAVLNDASIGEEEQLKILKELLNDKNAKPNYTGETEESPMHVAALKANIEAIYLLMRYGASVNVKDENGITPLFGAAWSGSVDAVKILLAAKADAKVSDNSGSTPLHVAAMKGNTEIVKMLIGAGAHVNGTASILSYDDTPLHLAAWSGDTESVKLLLKAGADIEATDYNDNTALQIAQGRGHEETAKLLQEIEDKS